ncbi:MAG: tRNA lysidine(34) synthetase TilS [Pseudomonadota bacterium]
MSELTQDVISQFNTAWGRLVTPEQRVGLMVSGGSDSLALMHLARDMHDPANLYVLTVNHGLRSEADAETEFVRDLANRLGLNCTILNVSVSDQGNLAANARIARYAAAVDAAGSAAVDLLATGHTRTDQAETFLIRLARGSGVDGLSAMEEQGDTNGFPLIRPLLGQSREDLRSYLSEMSQDWIDDPSNEDPKYARVQFRQAKEILNELGLSEARLVETSAAMRRVRSALDHYESELRQNCLTAHAFGCIDILAAPFWAAPEELQYRLLTSGMRWVTGETYRPRLNAVQRTLADLKQNRSATLQGCLLIPKSDRFWVLREPNAVKSGQPGLFDNRWLVDQPVSQMTAGALNQIDDWRDYNVPREAWLSLPVVLENGHLRSVPVHARFSDEAARLKRPVHDIN